MKLEVQRISSGEDCTNGILLEVNEETGEKKFLAYTLEDEYREEKKAGETRMLHIINVPGFEYILIHCGNTDEHTAGCLLVGDTQTNNQIKKNGFIGQSTNAYKRIYPAIVKELQDKGCVKITYKNIA